MTRFDSIYSLVFRLVCSAALISLFVFPTAEAATGTRGYSGTQIFSTVGGDKDPGEPNHCGEPGGASSWFFYKAPSDGVLVVDTQGSSFDTVLAVYIGPGTSYDSLTNVACNNDSSPGNLWSRVVFDVTGGTMYYIAVDGVGGATGTVNLNYLLGDPLTITNQPQPAVAEAGTSASFTVAAIGAGPLSYQWYYGGTPLPNATEPSLTLASVALSDEGAYSVLVQDASGSIWSDAAMLRICAEAPQENTVAACQMLIDGGNGLRLIGMGSPGSVLEASENLMDWVSIYTNVSAQDLFLFDHSMDQPQRYFRVRISP